MDITETAVTAIEWIRPITRDWVEENVEVDEATGCWLWPTTDRHGYGKANRKVKIPGEDGTRTIHLMHRLSYLLYKGLPPDGYHVHHKCHTKRCCNPVHLEAITPSENSIERHAFHRGRIRPLKPTCKNGHLFDETNTYKLNGRRYCRACNRAAVKRYQAKQKAEAA